MLATEQTPRMSSDEECAICLSRVTPGRRMELSCGHVFHASCVRKWFSKSLQCPCCRRGSVEALRLCAGSCKIHVSMKRVLERAPFPDVMSDADKIRDVVGCDVVMRELGVGLEDRAFMLILADVANDAKHFIDMLRRLSSHFETSPAPSRQKSTEDDRRIPSEVPL